MVSYSVPMGFPNPHSTNTNANTNTNTQQGVWRRLGRRIEGVDKLKPTKPKSGVRSNVKTFRFILPNDWSRVRPAFREKYST